MIFPSGLVPYEQVVAELAADTLSQVSCLGLEGKRFMPDEFSQLACVSLKVGLHIHTEQFLYFQLSDKAMKSKLEERFPDYFVRDCNFRQDKIEQQSPHPLKSVVSLSNRTGEERKWQTLRDKRDNNFV